MNRLGTEKKISPEETHRRLREQYTEIAQLAGGLAHEVKNPLSTIRLNLDLLAEEMEEFAESPSLRRAMRRVETVRSQTVRLEELLNEFLNFTHAHHLDLTAADPNKELREVVDFFRPQAERLGVEIVEYFAADLPTIRVDRRSFQRAILNLLLNAAAAMPDGGQIVVRTRHCGGEVAIDLIDTGCGMEDATVQKIFDPFFSTKLGGTGLGLPTVRKIVEGHGGRIALLSEAGRGTQFTLTFAALPQIRAEEKPSVVLAPDNTKGKKP